MGNNLLLLKITAIYAVPYYSKCV